jgi:hypothetical protein
MSELATLTACPRGHVIHYPAVLDDVAIQRMQEIAFCSACECGTVHFVVIWAGDATRLMESGGVDLFERFEATGWPEHTHADEYGMFLYRSVENSLDIAIFQRG